MADEENKPASVPLGGPAETLYGLENWTVESPEGRTAKGHGANFPGTATGWTWSDPDNWPEYRVHLAGLAYRRQLLNETIGEMGVAALRMLSSRLLGEIIGPENLTQAIGDAAREFELDPGRLTYWLVACGLILLGRESVGGEEIKRVTVIDEAMLKALLASKE